MDEAMECNGWTLTVTMVWLDENGNWQRCLKQILNRRVVRSKNQTEWETVDHWHARGGGLLSNDWLEDKEKRDLITCGTCVTPWWCHAHEMIVYNKILLKSSLDYSQNDLGSNDILMKKINVLVWTNGVNWTILDDWQCKVCEGGASFEKS